MTDCQIQDALLETGRVIASGAGTNSPITIRDMRATDFDRGFLTALGALKPAGLTEKQARRIFRLRKEAGTRTFVAVIDNRIVGTASLMTEQKFIHSGGIVGHIEDVAVHSAYQRHGIGSKLIEHALQVCRDIGAYKVILDCEDDVVPFYEKQGFHHWEQAMRVDLLSRPTRAQIRDAESQQATASINESGDCVYRKAS